jgi:two-component system, chemotaxis family, chemotaxis protein CheY
MLSDKEEHRMDGQGKKILVAEDYASNRNLLAYLLEQAQYEVHIVEDGYEALERMFNGVFDAALMDWDMPRLNGADFLSLSRILWPKTPVIIVSAHHAPSRKGLPQGAFAWVNKPYESKELLQILQTAVQTASRRHREQSITTTVLL